ncbi:hypothetical protein Y032_0180g777 [Ancylostoma ceylanicum]|uniref:Receptor L-domain domain-containing protein n=1 Tax=Ancylostoma ceylanicum TaxID=53326 RepID=A0A016SSD6_9BILA|nr:hypothetical protein Y032_0180g777 [Ancylostoma ceylanicum]
MWDQYPVNANNPYNETLQACFTKKTKQKEFNDAFRNKKCSILYGELYFSNEAIAVYEIIQNICKIVGCLSIIQNTKLENMTFTKLETIIHDHNLCSNIYALRVIGNTKLTKVQFHENFTVNKSMVYIRVNERMKNSGIIPEAGYDYGSPEDCTALMAKNKSLGCRRVIGEVHYYDYVREFFSRDPPIEVHGMLIFSHKTSKSLEMLENAIIVGHQSPALLVSNNEKLTDVSAILKINMTGPPPVLRMEGNHEVCHTADIRERLNKLTAPMEIVFSNKCLLTCSGGVVDEQFLREIENCSYIKGDLIIAGFKDDSDLSTLKNIETIEDGSLIFENNTGIKDLSFLKYLTKISNGRSGVPLIQIANNKGLERLALKNLHELQASKNNERVLEIYTFTEISDEEKAHFLNISLKRAVFFVGDKYLRTTTTQQTTATTAATGTTKTRGRSTTVSTLEMTKSTPSSVSGKSTRTPATAAEEPTRTSKVQDKPTSTRSTEVQKPRRTSPTIQQTSTTSSSTTRTKLTTTPSTTTSDDEYEPDSLIQEPHGEHRIDNTVLGFSVASGLLLIFLCFGLGGARMVYQWELRQEMQENYWRHMPLSHGLKFDDVSAVFKAAIEAITRRPVQYLEGCLEVHYSIIFGVIQGTSKIKN